MCSKHPILGSQDLQAAILLKADEQRQAVGQLRCEVYIAL
jgi:hypothetical protein